MHYEVDLISPTDLQNVRKSIKSLLNNFMQFSENEITEYRESLPLEKYSLDGDFEAPEKLTGYLKLIYTESELLKRYIQIQ